MTVLLQNIGKVSDTDSRIHWHSDRDTLHEKNIGTVTVTLYSRKLMALWQWHFTREKHWHSDSDTLLEKKHWHIDSDTLLKKINGAVTVTLYSRKILAQWQ
jgi:hypothetical protein